MNAVKAILKSMLKDTKETGVMSFRHAKVSARTIPGKGKVFLIEKDGNHYQRMTVDAAYALING